MISLTINGQSHNVDVEPDTPLLWAIRENVGLTGTKYGCGVAQCGSCTVHVDGVAMRSCATPVSAAAGKRITTIEGLAENGVLHKVQQAWLANEVPQCGYCQSGMIMAVAALLQGQAEADRRRHQRRDHQYLPLRHLPAGARGDPRRSQRVTREGSMNYVPKIDRRSFVIGTAAAGAGFSLGMTCRSAPPMRQGTPELNAWVVVRPDDTVVVRFVPLRDGPGRADRPLPAGRRRARMRLVEGHLGICRPAREHPPQAHLRQLQLDRLERDPPVARLCAARRRGGAADADPGRGQRVEGAGVRVHGGEQPDHAHAVRPQDQLRQGRERGRQDRAAGSEEPHAQGPEGLEDRRQADQAA